MNHGGVLLSSCCSLLHQFLWQSGCSALSCSLSMELCGFPWCSKSNWKSLDQRWHKRPEDAYFLLLWSLKASRQESSDSDSHSQSGRVYMATNIFGCRRKLPSALCWTCHWYTAAVLLSSQVLISCYLHQSFLDLWFAKKTKRKIGFELGAQILCGFTETCELTKEGFYCVAVLAVQAHRNVCYINNAAE